VNDERIKISVLKIAVSAICLLICALLVALWVRSYWTADILRRTGSAKVTVISMKGVITVSSSAAIQFDGTPSWQCKSTPTGSMMPDALRGWYFRFDRNGIFVRFPYRLPIAIFLLSTAVPWIRWRFGLRTSLIAIALVSLMLATALYFGR
jgi:hypothetical protein